MKKRAAKKAAKKAATAGGRISKALRAAIEANRKAGETDVELWARSGVDASRISRFVSGKRDIQLSSADQLAEALGFKLVKDDSTG